MRIVDMNWMRVEEYLRRDDRAVLPLGSVEQHGYLSLGTDAMLAERVSVEAAEPHNWWNAPRTWAVVQEIDRLGAHGSWMENFPWNRVAEVPSGQKPLADLAAIRAGGPVRARELLGDGNFGGDYRKPDADMLRLWETGVEETREVIRGVA